MKHFTLFLAAAALATSAMAQAPQKLGQIKLDQPVQQYLNHKLEKQQAQPRELTQGAKKASRRAASSADIVTEVEGTTQIYRRSGFGFQSSMFGISLGEQNGMAAEVVYDNDGKTVWFKDIVTYAITDAYVKGTLSEDGKTITVDLGQLVYYTDMEGWGMKLAMGNFDEVEEGYVMDETTSQVTFSVEGDELILNDTDNEWNIMSTDYPQRLLGLFYEDTDPSYDGLWAGYGDYQTVLSPVQVEPIVAPEGLAVSDWLFEYDYDSDGARDGRIVKCGIDGDKIYFQGLNDYAPELWAMGVIEGDKVRVPNKQYMGLTMGIFTYLVNADSELMYDEYYEDWYMGYVLSDQDFMFNYDPQTQVLTSAVEGSTLLLNASEEEVYYVYAFVNPAVKAYVEMPGRPQDPSVLSFEDAVLESGLGLMQCYIPLFDVNGNFMNPEKVAYKIWISIDDEEEEFPIYTDEYYEVPEDMVEIPYNFSDGWDIELGGSYFYFYQTGFDKMGVQSINYCGGERHESNIVWNDGSVSEVEDVVGIQQVHAAQQAVIYDLMGRMSQNKQGLKVVRMGDKSMKVAY